MSPQDAAKLLDLPTDATTEQLEARFLELRAKLEDKIAKAPTPGLKAKYRESLEQITTAFETLTLAADSSALPVLQKYEAQNAERPTEGRSTSPLVGTASVETTPPRSAAKRKSGGWEFMFVALLAVVLLGGGGWWIMKTRADNAAALERKIAEEQAEAARVSALKTSLRTKLAGARVEWEARESELQDAERRTNELKSELRSLRDAPGVKKAELSAQVTAQELFTRWLKDKLLRHPAKLARAQAEDLLQAGAITEATAAIASLAAEFEQLTQDIAARRQYFFEMTAGVHLQTKPEGLRWIATDTYGRVHEGKTPAHLTGLPLTHLSPEGDSDAAPATLEKRGEFTSGIVSVRFSRPGWPEVMRQVSELWNGDSPTLSAEFPEGSVAVKSLPAGVPFKITQTTADYGWTASGTTPATVTGVPVGRVTVRLSRPGYGDVWQNLDVAAGRTATTLELDQRSQPVRIKVAEAARIFVDGKLAGTKEIELATLAPGEHALQLEAKGYRPYRTKFSVAQKATPALNLTYSFKQLAVENITCNPCSGAGSIAQSGRCNSCNGSGRIDCTDCRNGVTGYVQGDFGGGVMGPKAVLCSSCNRRGYFTCNSCTNGTAHWRSTCNTCSGDGRVSQLQLSP